jgi:hypothetical protein
MRTDPWYPLRYELARSRRYEKQFVLAAGQVGEGGRASARQTKAALETYARLVRDTDAVWVHRGRLFLLLAETTLETAPEVIERFGRSVSAELRIAELRMAGFPADGLTSAALTAAVEERNAVPSTHSS